MVESGDDPRKDASFSEGLARLKAGDGNGALAVLVKAPRWVRQTVRWRLAETHALYVAGRELQANRSFNRLIQEQTSSAARAWVDAGTRNRRAGQSAQAEAAWRRGLWLEPGRVTALSGLCAEAVRSGHAESAIAFALALLERARTPATARARAGSVFMQAGDTGRAWRAFEAAAADLPEDLRLHAAQNNAAMTLAEWPSAARAQASLTAAYAHGEFTRSEETPFRALGWCMNDEWNLQLARAAWASAVQSIEPITPPTPRPMVPARPLRVGYLSGDWYQHAMLNLTIGLFEQHDPAAVEVCVYCHSRDDGSWLRGRLKAAVPHFVDVNPLTDAEAAARIRDDQLDVLVDCMGFTRNNRARILAYRPAPVQVNWLGFPGSMGSEVHDYIIADPVVIPEEAESAFSEAVCRLPEAYQANDNRRPIAANAPTRAEEGLPDTGLVFCSFNQAYKLEPVRWVTFMAILRDVPDSVLWLLDPGPEARENLRMHAQSAGMDPDRLVFAPKRPGPLHLARVAHADLALDTRIYNGHTTTADALWVGVPVLATQGGHFASRVSESLLRACHLPELVLPDEAALHARAVALAKDPAALQALRERVASNRFRAPLFDTERYARHMEAAFRAMVERASRGERPTTLAIDPLPPRAKPFAETIPRPKVNHEPPPEPPCEHDPYQQWTHTVCPICTHPEVESLGSVPWTESISTVDAPLSAAVWCRCLDCGHTYTRHHWSPSHPWAGAALPIQPGPEQAARLLRMLPGGKGSGKSQGRKKRSQSRAGVWLEVRPHDLALARVADAAGYTVAVMEAAPNLVEKPAGLQITGQRFLHTKIKAKLSVLSLPGVLACTPFPDLYLHRAAGLLAPGAQLFLTAPLADPGSSAPTEPQAPALLHRFSEKTLRHLLKETGFIWQKGGAVPHVLGLYWVVAKRSASEMPRP